MPRKNKIGAWIAMAAIILALGFGILEATGVLDVSAQSAMVTTILVIAGLVIGALNIQSKESVPFLLAALVLALGAGLLATLPAVGSFANIIFARISQLVIPAATVVALVIVWRKIKN